MTMNYGKITARIAVAGFLFVMSVQCAWAADALPFTRATFDQIMRYVNFIILASLVIKYARRPIANFLNEKKLEVGMEIQRLEETKLQVENQSREIQIQLDAGQQRLSLIKEKIIAQGQNRKEQLITEAQADARLLMETARRKIESRISDAKDRLRSELIDMAADRAAAKLSVVLTPADQERMMRQWLEFTDRISV